MNSILFSSLPSLPSELTYHVIKYFYSYKFKYYILKISMNEAMNKSNKQQFTRSNIRSLKN